MSSGLLHPAELLEQLSISGNKDPERIFCDFELVAELLELLSK